MNEIKKPLACLSDEVENVVIFVCDALRWDYRPESVLSRGTTFKTIASSLFTAPSFPSIASGLYPHRHGVFSFTSVIDSTTPALTNIPGVNFSLWTETAWVDFDPPESGPLYRVLSTRQRVPLETIETPFVYLEDDKGGHAPYSLTFEEYDKSAATFFKEYGGQGLEKLRSMYREGVEQSVSLFEKRLETLARRGLLDSTLVIFTSDHGELLGEYGGLVGHSWFASPELVFVPATFIHPLLPAGESISGKVIRHVDFFPTILALLNQKAPPALDGISLLDGETYPDYGVNYCRKAKASGPRGWQTREEKSLWDWHGGHVFRSDGFLARSLSAIHQSLVRDDSLTRAFLSAYNRNRPLLASLSDYWTLLRVCSLSKRTCLDPQVPRDQAEQVLASLFDGQPRQSSSWMLGSDEDEEILDRLRDLGYVE